MSLQILTVGLPKQELASLDSVTKLCKVISIEMDLKLMAKRVIELSKSGASGGSPDLVLVGTPPEGVNLTEVGQILRMNFPDNLIYAITRDRKKYFRKLAIKNGFSDSFLYPLESSAIKRALQLALRIASKGAIKAYRPVRVLDLKVGSPLPVGLFVFLPMNAKYIPFLPAGDPLTEDHYRRLVGHKVDTVYVNIDEMPEFYKYAGFKSLTERRHILEDRFRIAMSGLFRGAEVPLIEEGKHFVEECKKAVSDCILDFPPEKLAAQVFATMGDVADHYNHALNTSTYAALFSKILGKGDPMHLALAGLWHDIGIIELGVDPSVQYEDHVSKSADLMQELRIAVDPSVSMAVMQHHERWDGQGYPLGLMGDLISAEGQILILADQFDYATRFEPGEPQRSPLELVERFKNKMIDRQDAPIPPKLAQTLYDFLTRGTSL